MPLLFIFFREITIVNRFLNNNQYSLYTERSDKCIGFAIVRMIFVLYV